MGTFGQRLRELRKQRGISQNELSKHIGVSKSSVNMYERGEREPGFETLEAIADFFNVNMDYLLGRNPIDKVVDNFDPTKLSKSAGLWLSNLLVALANCDEEIPIKAEEMYRNCTLSDMKYIAELFNSLYAAFIEEGLDSNIDADAKEHIKTLREKNRFLGIESTSTDFGTNGTS